MSKFDILEFSEKFLEIEEKENLFNLKHNDLYYWDIVRYHIFCDVFYSSSGIEISNKTNPRDKISIIKKVILCLKYFYFTLKKTDYIFFTTSRNLDENNKFYDINLNELITSTTNSLIIETRQPVKYGNISSKSVHNYGLAIDLFFNKTIKRFFGKKEYCDFPKIEKLFFENFNFKIHSEIMQDAIDTHLIHLNHYKKLFKRIKPKAVFVIQNGQQKGLFAAANQLKIPAIEMQHSLIGTYSLLYSYPNSIQPNKLETLPQYFFSYSEFWTKNINYPVVKKIAIGNTTLAKKIDKLDPVYSITILYADGYDKLLNVLINDLLSKGFHEKICIKLHPSLFNHHSDIIRLFQNYPFIDVIKNEKSVEQLFAITKTVLTIHSTVVYQSLYNGIPVLLYTVLDYRTHRDVFNNPLLFQVNDAGEIIKTIKTIDKTKAKNNESEKYFKEFDYLVFQNFLQKY